MALEIIVLAAGQGKRMRSQRPKILHPLAGRPLLAHVLAAARTLSPHRTVVVHGHGAGEVRSAFDGAQVEWVLQAEQLGTGHAVQQAMPRISSDADVLILYGDVPLVRPETLRRLSAAGRTDLSRRLDELEKKYAAQFRVVFEAIRALMEPPEKARRSIGFGVQEARPAYRVRRLRGAASA